MPYNLWLYIEFTDGDHYEDSPEPIKLDKTDTIEGAIQTARRLRTITYYGKEQLGRLPKLQDQDEEELRAWSKLVEKGEEDGAE